MSLEDENNQREKLPNTSQVASTVWDIKWKVNPLVTLSFRRIMFENIFNSQIKKILDDLSLDFFRTTGWFNEIIIIKIEWDKFQPVYDYSLRDKWEDWIKETEFVQLAQIGKNMGIWEWDWVDSAGWTSFDMVGKVSNNYLMCVNNTDASINELEEKYPNRIFEEVKPIIERMIMKLKDILPI